MLPWLRGPGAGDPGAGDPGAGDTGAGDPGAGDPGAVVPGAGDPGRSHTEGRMARAAIEDAREKVAQLLGARPRQVVFTSGATEAVNAAVWGATRARPGQAVALAQVEHSAVRDASARLAPVRLLPVDDLGRIRVDALEEALGEAAAAHGGLCLVHCQWGNHEVGTLQEVEAVVEAAHRHGALAHVDAAAAAGHVAVDVAAVGADLVSVSAHKMGGPLGAGALLLGRGVRIEPLIAGGEQERARRAGMENTPAIIGFGAVAAALCERGRLAREEASARALTSRVIGAASGMGGVEVLGDPAARLPHIACLAVPGVQAEAVLLGLDQAGIAAHSGSACSSESLAPSPVLEAMGADPERSLRMSVGWSTTPGDVEAFLQALPRVLGGLLGARAATGPGSSPGPPLHPAPATAS